MDELYSKSSAGYTFKDLISKIVDKNNILLAYRELKLNSVHYISGNDNLTIKDISKLTIEEVIEEVRKRINKYQPQEIQTKKIKILTGKEQTVGVYTIWDRLIHQCIKQIIEPICEAKFYSKSYGFRPNRSTEHALAEAISKINHNNLYYVIKIKLDDFPNNINHNKVIKQLWTMGIKDKKLLSIIKASMKAPVISENGNITKPTKGIQHGGIISSLIENIYLNEFDWWIAKQWEIFKPKNWNPKIVENGPSTHAKVRYVLIREGVKLKPIFLVRYLDEILLFTDTEDNANKILYACETWFEKRLKLEIIKEKSIINLKKQSVDFLGFDIKAIKKGKTDNKRGQSGIKYVADTHMTKIAKKHVKELLCDQIKRIQRTPNSHRCIKELGKYNSLIIKIHNYYKFATQVNADLNALAMSIEKRQYNRFPKTTKTEPTRGFTTKGNYSGKDKEYLPYMKSKMVRYLMGYPILPIGYVQTRNPMRKNKAINKYTESGRKKLYEKLTPLTSENLKYLRENPIINKRATIEYNDNRIALYVSQKGLDGITGELLDVRTMHCHHKVPWVKTKNDNYNNLILINEDVHKLIHATNQDTINKYLNKLTLSTEMIDEINKLRIMVDNEAIMCNK